MMKTDPSSLAAEMAQVTMCFINIMGVLASPRIIAKAPALPSREQILEHIDAFLSVLARASHSTQASEGGAWRNSEPHVLTLRELFHEWTPEQGISPEFVQTARKCLIAFEISAPPGGWDVFEGIEDDSSGAESRAVDTTPLGEALAAGWHLINWASIFVIPSFMEAHSPGELRTELLQRIDRYLEVIDPLRDQHVQRQHDERGLLRLEPYASKLRTMLCEWAPDEPVPSEIIQTVDACLKSVGVLYSTTNDAF
jgi:hypothetical protein